MKTIEEQVEEFDKVFDIVMYNSTQGTGNRQIQNWLKQALTEAHQAGYEKGHTDALRTIPVYESDYLQDKK